MSVNTWNIQLTQQLHKGKVKNTEMPLKNNNHCQYRYGKLVCLCAIVEGVKQFKFQESDLKGFKKSKIVLVLASL